MPNSPSIPSLRSASLRGGCARSRCWTTSASPRTPGATLWSRCRDSRSRRRPRTSVVASRLSPATHTGPGSPVGSLPLASWRTSTTSPTWMAHDRTAGGTSRRTESRSRVARTSSGSADDRCLTTGESAEDSGIRTTSTSWSPQWHSASGSTSLSLPRAGGFDEDETMNEPLFPARSGLYFPLFDELAEPAAVARLAAEAEEAGWHGVFLWDHLRWREPIRQVADPWITLTAIATATEKVMLGPMVSPLARRRPAKVARETATLDRLSGGRLILGVGLGGDRFAQAGATVRDVRGDNPAPYDIAVELPPGSDLAPYAEAGAAWWMTGIEPGVSLGEARSVL